MFEWPNGSGLYIGVGMECFIDIGAEVDDEDEGGRRAGR